MTENTLDHAFYNKLLDKIENSLPGEYFPCQTFAEKLCRLIDYDEDMKHYSITDLAETVLQSDVKAKRQTFERYMGGKYMPDDMTILRISRFFHVPIYYLKENSIKVMDKPERCPVPEKFKGMSIAEIEHRYCFKSLMKTHLKSENKQSDKALQELLEGARLTTALMYRLTPAAREMLTGQIESLVSNMLSDKDNLYQPINPTEYE